MDKTFVDFFAGTGLFRLGMERHGWQCAYAVDHDPRKAAMYRGHFGDAGHYAVQDVHDVRAADIPTATLAHASFPCTDLSLAGGRGGLSGPGSSAFWAFVRVLDEMGPRRPPVVTLENVPGFVTSNGGRDLEAALDALNALGYAVDALVLDAAHFVPQSRARLFVVGAQQAYRSAGPFQTERALSDPGPHRTEALRAFVRRHPHLDWSLRALPPLPIRAVSLAAVVEADEAWWDEERTSYLLSQMSEHHGVLVREMRAGAAWRYGTAFRRMRVRDGVKRSTAELRADGVAGCLRTPKGGSAKQILVRAGRGRVDARLLTGRECARLMGADRYALAPTLSNDDVLFGFGDAVCVPAVAWLAEHVLAPLVASERERAVFEPVPQAA